MTQAPALVATQAANRVDVLPRRCSARCYCGFVVNLFALSDLTSGSKPAVDGAALIRRVVRRRIRGSGRAVPQLRRLDAGGQVSSTGRAPRRAALSPRSSSYTTSRFIQTTCGGNVRWVGPRRSAPFVPARSRSIEQVRGPVLSLLTLVRHAMHERLAHALPSYRGRVRTLHIRSRAIGTESASGSFCRLSTTMIPRARARAEAS